MNSNERPIDLVEVARASGLRYFLHGVNASDARQLLAGFIAELDRRAGAERITWTPAEQLPDSDVTVQLFDPKASEPVWPGYYDGERWLYIDGVPAKSTHYANMPRGPIEQATGNGIAIMDDNQQWQARARRACGTI